MHYLILLQSKTLTGINKFKAWAEPIAYAILGVFFLICVVRSAAAFMSGNHERGWLYIGGAIISFVLFALMATIQTEIPALFK